MTSPPVNLRAGIAWLEEPDLAIVLASLEGGLAVQAEEEQDAPIALGTTTGTAAGVPTGGYLTNPAAYISFRPGGLRGHVLWPEHSEAEIDFVHFRILSHCLPSNRGDRVTTPEGIREAVEGATPSHVSELVDTGILLPRAEGAAIYSATRLWVRHSWYLSLLAHLEAAASPGGRLPASSICSLDFLDSLGVLTTRRTTRNFAKETVPLSRLTALLSRATGPELPPRFQAFLACLDVEGIPRGIYEWLPPAGTIGPHRAPVTPEDARRMAVGQSPAESAAALILLIATVDTNDARQYEMDLLDLGRLGQRVCLVAEELGLGIFLTPALADDTTLRKLGVPNPLKNVAYLFALGDKHVP